MNKSFQIGQQQNAGGGREGRARKGHESLHSLLPVSSIVLLLLSYSYKRVTLNSGFGLKGKAHTLERHYSLETQCLFPAHPERCLKNITCFHILAKNGDNLTKSRTVEVFPLKIVQKSSNPDGKLKHSYNSFNSRGIHRIAYSVYSGLTLGF